MHKCPALGLFVLLLCGACGLIPQRLTACSASRSCPTGFWCEPETSMCLASASPDAMSLPDLASSPDLPQPCTTGCQTCLQHADCPSQVCNSYLPSGAGGTCVPAAEVVYVDNRGSSPCGPGGDGETAATALCGLPEALARIDGIRKRVIRVMPSGRDYGSLAIADRAVTIFGPAGQGGYAELSGAAMDGLSVGGSARVVIDGLDISRSRVGISCRGSGMTRVTVRRSSIARNTDTGIQISDCALEADRVLVRDNGGGALFITGTRTYSVTNSFLVRNRSLFFPTLKLLSSASGTFQFNTVVDNDSNLEAGIRCSSMQVEIRDSIVFHNSAPGDSQFKSCTVLNTVVGIREIGKGIRQDPIFAPVAGIDYGLDPERSAACCIDQALPALREDYFGTGRPRGLAADLGAHEAR